MACAESRNCESSLDRERMTSESDKSAMEGKAALRTEYKARLRGLAAKEMLSEKLVSRLESSTLLDSASVMVGFMPIKQEPDILGVMDRWLHNGRRLFLPVFSEADGSYGLAEVGGLDEKWISRGKFGIPEPKSTISGVKSPFHFAMPAIWLVPGLAFTEKGVRLGRGGGYYDRLLKGADGVKVGILFECQLAAAIPALGYDIHMDFLLTEARTIDCATA